MMLSVRAKGAIARLGLALLMFVFAPRAHATLVIDHGDFIGDSVMYLDVIEAANSPGDDAPIFRTPTLSGSRLDFNPAGFAATALGNLDLIDVQLNFTLMGTEGNAISKFRMKESGDYSLIGAVPPGTAVTQVNYSLAIGDITVLEVDGQALTTPVTLSLAGVFGGDNISLGTDLGTPWGANLTYDIDAALSAAGVSFRAGATKLEVAINNTLSAIAEPSTIAFIAKKDFTIDVSTRPYAIPEPSSFAFLAIVGGVTIIAKFGRGRLPRGREKRSLTANCDADTLAS